MIKNCDCKHEYQDQKYGPGRRVMNLKKINKGDTTLKYTCTVCEKTHLSGKN